MTVFSCWRAGRGTREEPKRETGLKTRHYIRNDGFFEETQDAGLKARRYKGKREVRGLAWGAARSCRDKTLGLRSFVADSSG